MCLCVCVPIRLGGVAGQTRSGARVHALPPLHRGWSGICNTGRRVVAWVQCPWGGDKEESLCHDAEPSRPKGVTPPTTVTESVVTGRHHGASALPGDRISSLGCVMSISGTSCGVHCPGLGRLACS